MMLRQYSQGNYTYIEVSDVVLVFYGYHLSGFISPDGSAMLRGSRANMPADVTISAPEELEKRAVLALGSHLHILVGNIIDKALKGEG